MKTTTTLLPASLGSISTATLRTEDLLSAFADELLWQLQRNGHFFSLPENFALRDRLNLLIGEAQDCWNDDGHGINPEFEDIAEELINESFPDALQLFAKPYCYFGSHEGDGSDFGYWPSMEAIDELPTVEGSDAARELGEDCKSVNDHGNVTIWNSQGVALLELV